MVESFTSIRFTSKFLSIARGMITGTSGATEWAKYEVNQNVSLALLPPLPFSPTSLFPLSFPLAFYPSPSSREVLLTPADKRHSNNVACGVLAKHNDKFLEHEQGLRPHPHHSHQSEVVDQH